MEYQIILTAIIAFVAVMTGLGFIFNLLLKPINNRLSNLEAGLAELEVKLDKLLAKNSII